MEAAAYGRADDWGEVVTRYPYGNVGMDHLLSREKRAFLLGYECSDTQGRVPENRITYFKQEGRLIGRSDFLRNT